MNLRAEITKAILLVNSGNPRDPDGWLVTDIYKQSPTQLGEPGWHSVSHWLLAGLTSGLPAHPLSTKSLDGFLSPQLLDSPFTRKGTRTEPHTTHSCCTPNHADSVDTYQDLPSQEHPAPDFLEFSEIWSGEAALLQGLRNSTEWNLPACSFNTAAHLSWEKQAQSKWTSLMFLFIWHIIPLRDEMALLLAATNDRLDLWCSNLWAINHVRS